MIDPDFRRRTIDAPSRLARRDVQTLRGLWASAQASRCKPEWSQHVSIPLTRDARMRAALRLGKPAAATGAVLTAQWRLVDQWGLDLTVHANPMRKLVGTHRFRADSTEVQFTREASLLVRYALGWAKKYQPQRI